MFKHILVPVDGSATALQAVREATRMAQAVKARITLMHAIQVYPYAGLGDTFGDGLAVYLNAAHAAANAAIAEARAVIDAGAVACESRIVEGNNMWRAIVDAVPAVGADLIVMGTHGRGMIDRMLLGSVAQRVLANASVPVMVVHGKE